MSKSLFRSCLYRRLLGWFAALTLISANMTNVSAEVSEVRITRQYGLGYLPLIVMEDQKLLEQHAQAAGLGDVKATWVTLGGGSAATDALLSNSVDVIGTGVTPMLILWAKTRGQVKGIAPLGNSPLVLNTIRPEVKSLADLDDKDRIALPGVKSSIQAIVLQMAAERAFGKDNYAKLDRLTVSMKHPDAMTALLSRRSEITAHLTSPPFSDDERKDPRVHAILDSYELLGGPHTFNVISAKRSFVESNPKIYAALLASLEEAMTLIQKDPKRAAELYIRVTRSGEAPDKILDQLKDSRLAYTTTPLKVTRFAEFMQRTGTIKTKPGDWKELFFPGLHGKQGGS